MAAGDNILEIFIRANIEGLKPQLDAASASVRSSIEAMKGAAATLPETITAAMSQATAAFVAANPQIQTQAATVIDLGVAYDKAKASLAETTAVLKESGGTANAETSILKTLAEETVDVEVKQLALKTATADLDKQIKSLIATQVEAATASKEQAAATTQAAEAATVSAAEFNAVGRAALTFTDGVIAASKGATDAAARVLDLKATLAETSAAFREAEAAIIEMGGAENASAEEVANYTRLATLQQATERELATAKKELNLILNEGAEAYLRSTQAVDANTAALGKNAEATIFNANTGKLEAISDET